VSAPLGVNLSGSLEDNLIGIAILCQDHNKSTKQVGDEFQCRQIAAYCQSESDLGIGDSEAKEYFQWRIQKERR
jgi:hypothetical protein